MSLRVFFEDEAVAPPYFVVKRGVTFDQYLQLVDEDTEVEYHEGALLMNSPASRTHERIFRHLLSKLEAFCLEHGAGEVLGSRFPVRLQDKQYEPDLLFVRKDRVQELEETHFPGAPDLVVEILSESTREKDLHIKRPAYQDAGVRELWLIDPERRELLIDRAAPTGKVQSLRLTEGVYESPLLPGFRLFLEALWEAGR